MTMTENPRKSAAKRYGKWLIGLTILLIGITGFAAWKFQPRVPLLLMIATEVVPKGRYYGGPLAWLSNEEYVCFGADSRTLSRYRLSSGVYTPLLKQFGAQWEGLDVQPSPNGKWLFWVKMKGPPSGAGSGSWLSGPEAFHAYITRLADTHTRELDGLQGGQWEPDSRHIIDISPLSEGANESTVVIRDALTSSISRTMPFAPNVSSTRGNTIMVAPDRLLGISPIDTLERFSNEYAPVDITEYGLDETLHITHKWSVALPPQTTLREAKISPIGDRIAWLVDAKDVAPGLAALHRLIPFIKVPSQPRHELWISRLDGTGMRILGETSTKVRNGNPLLIGDLRWLPDGKHLSFFYDGALWTVPAKP
ncbi:MAG: hypothetical protein JWL77_2989 [Chthonomonadaceae bacterium]|nr:hypothetical protein [Chthonomonadaceae bacterium]